MSEQLQKNILYLNDAWWNQLEFGHRVRGRHVRLPGYHGNRVNGRLQAKIKKIGNRWETVTGFGNRGW